MKKNNMEEKKVVQAADPVESDFGRTILFSLRRIIRAVDIQSRALAVEYGITGPQLACLMAVVEKESITATEIAERISLSTSTVIGILDRLEHKGILQRRRDEDDRRYIHVHATDTGRELIRKMPFPLKQPLNKALGKMSGTDQKSIALSLEQLVQLMDAESISADPLFEPVRFPKILKAQ